MVFIPHRAVPGFRFLGCFGPLLKPCTAPHQIKPSTAITEISVQCRANAALYRIQIIGYLHYKRNYFSNGMSVNNNNVLFV